MNQYCITGDTRRFPSLEAAKRELFRQVAGYRKSRALAGRPAEWPHWGIYEGSEIRFGTAVIYSDSEEFVDEFCSTMAANCVR